MPQQPARAEVVDAFLSHRYKSPEINLYFYQLISSVAPISFHIDRGVFRTSTTRLERMLRDADIFVGIYPIPGDPRQTHDRAVLRHLSRYFRLELDMAIRSHKPAIIFSDRRYAGLLQAPPEIVHRQFDAQEMNDPTRSPAWAPLRGAITSFWRSLKLHLRAQAVRATSSFELGHVGVLLPPYDDIGSSIVSLVEQLLWDRALEPILFAWPPQLNSSYLTQLRRCDWVIIDTASPHAAAIVAFLHGQFIPLLRLRHQLPTDLNPPARSVVEDVLFGGLEVGYGKDVITWRTLDDLCEGLVEHLDTIGREPEWIGDRDRAIAYFTSAAKRKERVFLSYAGEDAEQGAQFAAELGRYFQDVFDYRRAGVIQPGEPWLDQIIDQLAATAVGVILVSRHYQDSSYCRDEARRLYDAYLAKRVLLHPVKLDDARVTGLLGTIQYERLRDAHPAPIVQNLLRRLDNV